MNMHTPESNVRDDNITNRWKYLRWTSLVLIAGSLLYKFFDRSAMFHDEIINVAVGRNADIFNYALRPVFYTINALSVRFFGADTLALSLVAYLAFLVVAAYTYQYMKRDFGVLAGVAGVAALAWSGLIYYIGLRGMPHLYPALFFAAAIYYYHQTPIHRQKWRHRCLLAVLLWLALLSHPTALALLIGFFTMVVLDLFGAWKVLGAKRIVRILLTWSISMIAVWIAVEALFYAFSSGGQSYLGYWVTSLQKTSSPRHQHYFEPYVFYFEKLTSMLWPLLDLLAVLIFWLIWKAWRGRNDFSVFASDGWKRALGLFVVAMVSVGVISLEKWKFDRVLVTFVPIVTLCVVYLIFRLADSICRRQSVLFAALACFVVIVSAASFIGQAKIDERQFSSRYPIYSASFDVIRHLDGPNIGYIGDDKNLSRASYPVEGAGKAIKVMKLSPKASVNEHVLARELMAAGNRYIIISMLADQKVIGTFHKLAYSAGFSRESIFPTRRAYELWELSPSYLGGDIEKKLGALPRNSRLGLLLDRKRDLWVRWALDGKKFKYKALTTTLDKKVVDRYPFVFLSTSSEKTKEWQKELADWGMQKVGEIPAIDGKGKPVEMWGRL